MFLLLPAVGVAVAFVAGRPRWRIAATWAATAAASAGVATGVRWWIGDLVGNQTTYTASDTVVPFGELDQLLVGVSGRILSSAIALALPLAVLCSPRLRRAARSPDLRALWLCGGTLLVTQLVATAVVFWSKEEWRLDQLLYTRYQGPGIVLCCLAAGLTLVRAPSAEARPAVRSVAFVAGVLAVAAAVFGVVRDPALIRPGTVLPNIPELAVIHDRLDGASIVALAAAVVAVVLLAARFAPNPSVVLGAAIAVGMFVSYTGVTDLWIPASERLSDQRDLAAHLEHLDTDECVTLDASVPPFHRSNYEFFSSARFSTVDLRHEPPCGDLVVVATDRANAVPQGFELQARERFVAISLFARGG